MTQVNNIFLSSEFLNDYPAYGFEIKEIVVHTAPTNIDGHYNVNRDNWGTSELLTVIGNMNIIEIISPHSNFSW